MDSKQQLINSLTSHISLYSSSTPSASTPNPNPRLSILKWFSSLSLHQRQSHLTISDSNFALILLQMRAKIRSNGHGFFIVLPDIPSRDRPSIPSLCYKRSHGLLSRVSESNELHRLIQESVLMFNSKEGDVVNEGSSNCLDSIVVSESFVEDVDKFVEAMDSVSDGGFLRGEESVLSSDWVELNWLKAKGYYSLEAFVANKLEVALRLSWLNCNNVKKRGAKLKEKASLAGVAANVYWRKKGCVDWWKNLDYAIKQKLFRTFLGKAAKSLTAEILNGSDNTFEDTMWLSTQVADPTVRKDSKFLRKPSSVSRMPSTLVYVLKGLYILQDISILLLSFQNREEYCKDKLFFSSLGSVSTVSDCILRKLRGMLMVVSLDFTKMELLEEENFKYHPTKKSKEKVCSGARRKKGKTRNSKKIVAPDSISSKDEVILDKPNKEHNKESVSVNTQSSSAKNKKKRNKLDNSRSNSKLEAGMTQESKVPTSSTSVFHSQNSENLPRDASIRQEKHVPNSSSVSTTTEISAEENVCSTSVSELYDRNVAKPSEMDTNRVDSEEKPTQDPISTAVTNTSHEWPSVSVSMHRPAANIHHPSTTDRLHLDAGHHNPRLIVHHPVRNPNLENGILSRQPLPMMSLDWPPMVHSVITCNYAFHPQTSDDERVYPRDFEISQDLPDDEEDYSQFFGGGVMYWNPSDRPGSAFSRPPSMSSDDSTSWAWREADMNRTVDDMVTLTSPSSASFCSPFTEKEKNLPETQETEVKSGDSLPYKILRPIIIPRERSRSEFKRSHDRNSPCVPSPPRIRRPPSPVVLCVPHASPACDSRKHRGFPTVRSGSSSPRHWGVRGWFHDGINFEESCVRMDGCEVVWPSWTNKAHQLTQPLPGALLQDRLIAISQLALDHEHPDVAFPLQPPELMNCSSRKASLPLMHSLLHEEIDFFCKQVAAENMVRKPYINWALKRVTRSLQVLWPRSRTNIFGSNATGLNLPTSDVDLVVVLPPVRNLEPIKEAGILEGRNGIKETCLQHAARYLANQEWVKNDSLKIVENTAIPIIMLVVEVPCDAIVTPILNEGKTVHSVRLDISFKSPSHTGLQTTELVKELTEQFPAATPLALVLKQFLADRSLDQSYSGGLSSYCLILLITRFLQHEHHHGRTINQNFGGLLMDFLYFYGNVFDPRRMRISVHGTGVYVNRERGYSIDPICIDDPLFPANNVGRNCFRIHQCIKAFADAYTILENELSLLPTNNGVESSSRPPHKLLPKIVSSISGIL